MNRLLALTLAFAPLGARADTPGEAAMTYFDGEFVSAFGWLGLGIAGTAGGAVAILSDDDRLRPAGYPVAAVGGVHLLLGVYMLATTRARGERTRDALDAQPATAGPAEAARVDRVISTFEGLEAVEGLLIAGGLASLVVGTVSENDTAIGVGGGIAVEALATLIMDQWAHRRAEVYQGALRGFATPTADGGVALGVVGSF